MDPDAPAPRSALDSGTASGSSKTDPNRQVRGEERRELTEYVTGEYLKGQSIRDIASTIGRSYGFVHRLLNEGGVKLRTRGGARKAGGR
ncbi:helix-turn-helix domain-containing protein [Glycomyces tenuis]|uniref:helix-turn-helix domain-containing protein n=1 Tax=Glycomyces tenuis TaxID=58116 RepID=UPI00040F66B8|nr:helix-turn-helix domain-containing protein [Glycomyces tenuis]